MVRTECSSVKIVAPRKRAAQHALHSVSHWRRELPNKIVDGRMGQRERQSIPRGGMVTKGVAPALRAAGPPFQFARLNENLDVACRLYNDVRWREGLPRALVAKDDQGDSNSFLHVFGARNSFWRSARGCKAATRKGRERRQGECRKLRWCGHRAHHAGSSGGADAFG